jgi:hypothetical protein
MKWRSPRQRAPAILHGTAQADLMRASLCAELCGEALTFGRLSSPLFGLGHCFTIELRHRDLAPPYGVM